MSVDAVTGLRRPDRAVCLQLYQTMVRIRQFELAAQKNYRAGRMPGFIHLYIGEEAVAAGVGAHLRRQDWITSTHRGHGHALAKGVPARRVLADLYGRATGCCGGRGGSMHLFDTQAGLLGTTGIVAGGLPSAVGAALSAKVRGTDQVVVAFFGDGAVNHGAFHESVNFAGAQRVPIVFVCENNLYATATPFSMATRNVSVASRAQAYGLPGVEVDGNDVLALWRAAGEAVLRARAGEGPTLIEAKTYRVVGHHEGDVLVGTYRTHEELDGWKAKDPIRLYRQWLLAEGLETEEGLAALDAQVAREIDDAVMFAEASPMPDPASVMAHVLADPVNPPLTYASPAGHALPTVETNYLDAVRDGIAEEMRANPAMLYLGEGIGERGGTYGHTKGLWHEFGGARVIDTPISELGFTGAAAGASATGARAVADLMFVDFLFDAASQLVQQAAKYRYMSNGQVSVPMVVRAGLGAIKNAGPHHSGCYYPMYAHIPGLIVVVPSNPADAKGLMKTALRASDPVLFLEHKLLFGMKGPVPAGGHYVPFGQARVVCEGRDLTVVSCGDYVHRCAAAADLLRAEGIACEVIDLRTIVPLDTATVLASLARTGRLLVVDEAHPVCGIGAELAALAMEEAFDELDAPVGRLHPEPVTQPFSPALENAMVVTVEKIAAAARALVAGTPPRVRRVQGALPSAPASAPPAAGAAVAQAAAAPPAPAARAAQPGVPILMPNQDLTVTEATVVRWLRHVGDAVSENEAVVEVETAKAVVPIECPASGTLAEILAGEGVTVQLGESLGVVQPG